MNVGYARVSTTDQAAGLEAQQRDLKAAGATKTFSERTSSVAKRPKLAECLAFLREGDVLIVTKPDRLARSTAELLSIEADLLPRDAEGAAHPHAGRGTRRYSSGQRFLWWLGLRELRTGALAVRSSAQDGCCPPMAMASTASPDTACPS